MSNILRLCPTRTRNTDSSVLKPPNPQPQEVVLCRYPCHRIARGLRRTRLSSKGRRSSVDYSETRTTTVERRSKGRKWIAANENVFDNKLWTIG